jgi:hypothetical protein
LIAVGRVSADALFFEHAFVLSKGGGVHLGNFSVGQRMELAALDAHDAVIATHP